MTTIKSTLFRERLRNAMEASGMRPSDLAACAEIDITNISHMLAGERAPGLESMAKLLRALPIVNARWLITGENQAGINPDSPPAT